MLKAAFDFMGKRRIGIVKKSNFYTVWVRVKILGIPVTIKRHIKKHRVRTWTRKMSSMGYSQCL